MNHDRFARSLAPAAGFLEFGTGTGLTSHPAKFLSSLRIPSPTPEGLAYLRWVGSFVATVAASYLLALVCDRTERLRPVLEFPLVFRLASEIFSAAAVARVWLALPWSSVTRTDFALIGIPLWPLTKLQIPDVTSSSSSSSPY